jgi:hypothetical protein
VILEGLFNQEDSEFDARQVGRGFKWENDKVFRIVNKEGYEKMIEVNMSTGQWELRDSTVVPMKGFLKEEGKESMYYFEQYNSKIKTTFERQLRKYQRTFTNRQLSIKSKRAVKETEYVH